MCVAISLQGLFVLSAKIISMYNKKKHFSMMPSPKGGKGNSILMDFQDVAFLPS